ncbi:MAG: Gfo/Idh/MocA family oxidoreductase [Acidobacteriota bacterium]
MRVIVVGLGIQGPKRVAVAGSDVVATVDSNPARSAVFRALEDVPLDSYEAALVCTPDEPKIALLTYLLSHGKHVLVEKPLLAADEADLLKLQDLARATGAVCYTAYNHRFEPHLARAKAILDEGRIGQVYQARFFYGNGTARDVRNSVWRDAGLGVIPDLASHLLDLVLFLFGPPATLPELWASECFENRACDYFCVGFPATRPMIRMEGTLLSWRNSFLMDLVGETGSLHVTSLCKWGPTALTVRDRKLPSGKPNEETHTLEQPDPTWRLEYEHFRGLCGQGNVTNLANDIWINRALTHLAQRARVRLFA